MSNPLLRLTVPVLVVMAVIAALVVHGRTPAKVSLEQTVSKPVIVGNDIPQHIQTSTTDTTPPRVTTTSAQPRPPKMRNRGSGQPVPSTGTSCVESHDPACGPLHWVPA